jgi:hypothetical protein
MKMTTNSALPAKLQRKLLSYSVQEALSCGQFSIEVRFVGLDYLQPNQRKVNGNKKNVEKSKK